MRVYDEEERSLKNIPVVPEPCITGCGKLAYPGQKCPACSQSEHPRNCPTCLAPWDYKSDGYGRMVPIHPVTKCVPKPQPIALERSFENALDVLVCKECGEDFPIFENQRSKTMCDECRVERNRIRNHKSALAFKRRMAA